MKDIDIIQDIQKTIREECNQPKDYEGYIELCLLHDPVSMGDYYNRTNVQIKYLCRQALTLMEV